MPSTWKVLSLRLILLSLTCPTRGKPRRDEIALETEGFAKVL